MSEMDSLRAEVEQLRSRIAMIEETVFRRHRLSLAIKECIAKWPGPFSPQQIHDALFEFRPELRPELQKVYAVEPKLKRMAKAGDLLVVVQGAGQHPTIYEKAAKPGNRSLSKYNRKTDYESGLRCILRKALDELPEEFTLDDFRSYKEKNFPQVSVPHGTWSSTLYKLEQAGELIAVKKAQRVSRKIYARGEKRITATGQELQALESAWKDFRASMQLPEKAHGNWDEIPTHLARADAA